jgi:hypothetical protein
MRGPILAGLLLTGLAGVSAGSPAWAQSPGADFHTQVRCLAVYEAAASAIEGGGGDKAAVKGFDRNRERTALALAARRDLPAGQNPAALQEAEAKKLDGQGREALVGQAKACDKALGF